MSRFLLIICTLLIFVIFCSSVTIAYEKEINSLSAGMAENITKAGRKTIAVVDFTDLQGNVTELGRFLAEEFSVDLASAGKGFEVVDRTHLKALLKEYKLSFSDLVNPESAKKLGQIAGVEAIITGTITPFGESVRLTIKILDVSTAKVIGASSGNIPRTQAINELLARGIEAGTQALDASTPIQIISTPQATKAQSSEVENFIFEIQSCKLSGRTITCNLVITNKDKDRSLLIAGTGGYVYGNNLPASKLYDNYGNISSAKNVQLANIKDIRFVHNLLISGVSTKVSLQFEAGEDSLPTSISLLEVYIYIEVNKGIAMGNKIFVTKLRNIPITK